MKRIQEKGGKGKGMLLYLNMNDNRALLLHIQHLTKEKSVPFTNT